MVTATSPLSRQPTKLDYSSPTQFKFTIHQLPKVEFFTTSAAVPGISLNNYEQPTPFKNIPIIGDRLTYEDLTISFIVDEYLENYITIHNWMTGIGFPKSRSQFTAFRNTGSNTPNSSAGGNTDIGVVGSATDDNAFYSDATLTILSNKNNPIVEVRYADMFPTSLSALEYNQNTSDVEYITANITFKYKLYEMHTL
jgi:hypothetical protein|tara:strand:+ start:148 stop:738 length:591 start_codon:yes stop_codon:yes gene_type:complete